MSSPHVLGVALRRVLARGYHRADLRADVTAGVVVAIVALPLSMALAVAIGVPPRHGVTSAIVAGAAAALLGGAKFQVTGPSASFVLVLAPIVEKHGLAGALLAGAMAGLILLALGLARLGELVRFIPYPVTMGFMTGIAIVMATLQIKDLLGLSTGSLPGRFDQKLLVFWQARHTFELREAIVGGATLILLLTSSRLTRRVPAPLLAIGVVTIANAFAHRLVPTFSVATIASRFDGGLGGFALPDRGGAPSLALIGDLVGPAFALAMLGAIESLLSGVIADGLTRTKHDPNAELVGLGIANILGAWCGGIAATGALARTGTNIRAGARSPIAAITHAAVLLVTVALFGSLVARVPIAALAALLLVVAWHMAEVPTLVRLVRLAPRSDLLVLVTCVLLAVFVDMVMAVAVGFTLAAVLFMRRMADLTESRLVSSDSEDAAIRTPPGVIVYEIDGPLFFGAAQKAMASLGTVRTADIRLLVLHLGRVPVVDLTGFVALENAIASAERSGLDVVLAGPFPRPHRVFDRARLAERFPRLRVVDSLETALSLPRGT